MVGKRDLTTVVLKGRGHLRESDAAVVFKKNNSSRDADDPVPTPKKETRPTDNSNQKQNSMTRSTYFVFFFFSFACRSRGFTRSSCVVNE